VSLISKGQQSKNKISLQAALAQKLHDVIDFRQPSKTQTKTGGNMMHQKAYYTVQILTVKGPDAPGSSFLPR